jgi:hypothetical protein
VSVNLEYDVPHSLVSPLGEVPINVPGPYLTNGLDRMLFLLQPNPYKIAPLNLRVTRDDLSQADGTSLQPPYISGLVANLLCQYWVAKNGNCKTTEPACGEDLRLMDELLTLNLNALRNQGATPDGTQRLLWQPTGVSGRRMLTQCLVAEWMDPQPFSSSGGRGMAISFALATPFPYAVDEDAVNVSLTDGGGPVLIPNDGNAEYSSVVTVPGSTAAFAITRVDTGDVISYVGPDTIPGGQHAEIDFFTASIAEEGNDLIADLDPTVTVFFLIPPGGVDVTISGADCTFESRAAWL